MNQKLTILAAMVAVTALHVIRHNADRHVPGTETETFETDPDTAQRLVDGGAARYADAVDPAQADRGAGDQATADEAAAAKPAAKPAAAAKKR